MKKVLLTFVLFIASCSCINKNLETTQMPFFIRDNILPSIVSIYTCDEILSPMGSGSGICVAYDNCEMAEFPHRYVILSAAHVYNMFDDYPRALFVLYQYNERGERISENYIALDSENIRYKILTNDNTFYK